MTMQMPENFPERYRNAVLRAANLCSVKKHLQAPPQFVLTTSELMLSQP